VKTEAQLAESIWRFQTGFWEKRNVDRPPIGVVNQDVYLPIKYLRRPFGRKLVAPADIAPELAKTDYEFAFADRAVVTDDWMPFAAPWRAIPWLEASCGCAVRFGSGALAPEPCFPSLAALAEAPFPASNGWFDCLRRETERLVATAPADCWVSPTILRGPSDVLAALRGLSEFMCDVHDDPGALDRAAGRINGLIRQALDLHFSLVPPKLGGYGHIFGYWAPGRTIAIQEDVLGLCHPKVYREIFQKHNADLVRHLGAHVLFHLHSTGLKHYQDVLAIPGLAGLQMTIEANGPPLRELVPVFRGILERSRLLLFVDNRADELREIISKLPCEGLYLVVPQQCVPTEQDFRRFLRDMLGLC
jgi:hypothetical protein